MADKKKDKVNVRDLKPNKDAKGGVGRYAAGSGGPRHAQGSGGPRHAQGAGGPRGAN
jgi:hypothetical protein